MWLFRGYDSVQVTMGLILKVALSAELPGGHIPGLSAVSEFVAVPVIVKIPVVLS